MRPRSRPFYAAQVPTGETYVVDNRTGKVKATIRKDFDMVARWRNAQRLADQMNDAFEARFYWRRRVILAAWFALLTVAALTLAFR